MVGRLRTRQSHEQFVERRSREGRRRDGRSRHRSGRRSGLALAARRLLVREIPIRDDMIRLGQFLKLADLVESGSEARPLLATGTVHVNDEVETRRGRQLVKGDVVRIGPQRVRVV